ncbi:acetyl-CoA synthetase-like protein [Aspergillus brunneoviolaceus CBS 621.78]|uniref:Acetyl-CoA synthetase-like protein n=1 Tax=Aspergillus brunneoviolaceus CBS 621.78 TaxID=1450534 RepID=A0ACD1G1X4_9EURO|nr:acetyl-CoA synthetase-like protein [Aspergillus brunneoviolaceus CBS 621.78]RAH43173.1 acetyl-CoA synthetase-like protein [Aspergillus brunneoviolaceus CBS 621.78]
MPKSPVLTSIHIFESPTIISQVELVLVSFSWVCKTLTAAGLARLDFSLTVAVTYEVLANAINGLAHWLVSHLGPGKGEVLTYVGPNDLPYPALILGAVKAGYCKAHLLDFAPDQPRGPSVLVTEAQLHHADCSGTTPSCRGSNPEGRLAPGSRYPEELVSIEYPPFEFSKTYPEAALEPLIIIHTSRSTGIPKPITWTHETAVKHMRMQTLDPPPGFETQNQWAFGKKMYMMLPPFHAGGVGHLLFVTLPVGITLVMPISGSLPTAAGMVAARQQTPFSFAFVTPSIVSELAQTPELLDDVRTHLEFLGYCGGDLPQAIGDTVAERIKLVSIYGATEMGLISAIHSTTDRDPTKDWRYTRFHPHLGVQMRHFSGEEHELVMVRTPEYERHQFPFSIFPDRQEYHTSDLFIRHPHPAKADLWRTTSRLDDVIVFLNGEKTNPISMEQHIVAANREVTGCLVAGAQRFQAALIVELGKAEAAPSASERAAMIEKLWPSIQEANSACPAHARITKSHILFTTPKKPMLRAGKGTVQRAGTLMLYASELETLYADAEKLAQATGGMLAGPGSVDDTSQVAEYIRTSILAITGWSAEKLCNAENWFTLGLDSLQTITLTRELKHGLNLPALTPNLIYLHPSVTALTHAVEKLHQQGRESMQLQQETLLQERDQLLQKFTSQIELPADCTVRSATRPSTQTVVLTGSTGQLGSYILHALLRNPSVAHIHCLNRNEHAREIRHERMVTYGLTPLANDESRRGVSKQLQQTTTLIIHNAWTVNFSHSLAVFEPHLQGNRVRPHPETIITTTTPAPNGYANSKYIAEHLLAHAGQQKLQQQFQNHNERGPSFAFARVGQVAGVVRFPGLWNPAEWFPSLVRSSWHLKFLPDTLGSALNRIDWVPIDLLAEVLVDLALLGGAQGGKMADSARGQVQVYHPLNLHPKSWDRVLPVIDEELAARRGVTGPEVVPLREWVQRVRLDVETAGRGEGRQKLDEKELQVLLARNPAAKLLDLFEGLVGQTESENALETVRTAEISRRLQEVEGVQPEWLRKWVGEWLD